MLWKILMSFHISISSVDQHWRVPIHQLCSLVSMGTTDPYLCWGLKQNGSYFHTSTTVLPENVRGNAEQKDRKGWILWMRGEEEVVYSFFLLLFFLTKFESGIKRKGRLNECVWETTTLYLKNKEKKKSQLFLFRWFLWARALLQWTHGCRLK